MLTNDNQLLFNRLKAAENAVASAIAENTAVYFGIPGLCIKGKTQ
jgi:hypothetical protein